MHIYDIIFGLQSDNYERYHITLENTEEIIRKNLPNLEVMMSDLLQILFRVENKFNHQDFEKLKADSLKACLVIKPAKAAPIFFERLDYREASLGQKIRMLGLMQDAIKELSNSEENEPDFEDKAISNPSYAEEFKNFFEEPKIENELDKAQQIRDERVSSKTTKKLSYYSKEKEKTARRNYLLTHSEKFLYPLLAIPEYSSTHLTFLEEADLCCMYLKTLRILLHHSVNHPNYANFASETFKVISDFMETSDSQIRHHLLQLLINTVMGIKQFMLSDLKNYLMGIQIWASEISNEDGDIQVRTMADTLRQVLKVVNIVQ